MENKEKKPEAGYRLYTNKTGNFSFEIPGNCKDVVCSEQKIPTAAGVGSLMSYITENNEKAFMLGITELGITLDKESALQVMEYARGNVIEASETIASDSVEIHNLPALTLRVSRIENKIKVYMDILFCIKDDKQYQLEVVATNESALSDPEVLHFFESFKFL
ncbi:MAG: hypothetical protein JXJ04_06870 [Spirochaetales bacterium]|nr:hypothetical protein [Spirochaetales bacterium]